MAEEDKKEDQEEELVPVGEGVEEKKSLEEEIEEEKREEEGEDDLDGEEEEEEEEQRLGAGGEDEEKKSKRKEERKTRRQRQKTARDRDKKELKFLQDRNETLERRFSELDQRVGHSEVSQVDARITDLKSKIKLADQVISKAITSQDGDAYAEAQGIRDDLRDQLTRVNYAKNTLAARSSEQAPDPTLIRHAQDWMEDHDWWDPNGRDADSRRVSRIDNQLVAEGYDPLTAEYWEELSDRVEEALPHRYGNGDERERGSKKKTSKKTARKKGPTFSTGGRERPLKKNEVYISPERKAAMEEAGVWEDPELRQKYLKSYADYDRNAASNA